MVARTPIKYRLTILAVASTTLCRDANVDIRRPATASGVAVVKWRESTKAETSLAVTS